MDQIDHAADIASLAYKTGCFDYIILHGSLAKGTAHKKSDIDILFIEDENKKKPISQIDQIFKKARSSPFYADLDYLKTTALKNDSYIKSKMEKLENPALYINCLWNGLIFDGDSFTAKARENEFFRSCINRMKPIVQSFDPRKYRIKKDYR